eukprot:TRINITY_DN47782_c0_g1_i1.p1 TRINITY_DN47782_c0_g1~~TRINITY_DN47782_c0_g1_i1.p1  ORF type:complete len:650 (-),score=118.31 TRINITY_DN47782_c0_g1_i1:39-1988(-)
MATVAVAGRGAVAAATRNADGCSAGVRRRCSELVRVPTHYLGSPQLSLAASPPRLLLLLLLCVVVVLRWQLPHPLSQTAFAKSLLGSSSWRVDPLRKRWVTGKYSDLLISKIRKHHQKGWLLQGSFKVETNGLKLGEDGVNVAIDQKDLEKLAKEPVTLRLDSSGRTILATDKVERNAAWSQRATEILPSAQVTLAFEEFRDRYERLPKTHEKYLGQDGLLKHQSLFTKRNGKDDFRVVRTFSWPGGCADGSGATSIMLLGVMPGSAMSRRLARRAVYEVEPSGLLVQLCRERVGQHLVMPREHAEALANYARGYWASNPLGWKLAALHGVHSVVEDFEALMTLMGDLAYSEAVEEFVQSDSYLTDGPPKTLCLGDIRNSRLRLLELEKGRDALKEVPAQKARAKQLARSLIALANMGHKVVLGILDTDIIGHVGNWLESVGAPLLAVADASDIESGRESLFGDSRLGLAGRKNEPLTPAKAEQAQSQAKRFLDMGLSGRPLGSFLSAEGVQSLMRRKQRLLQMTRLKDLVKHVEPEKEWKVAEELWISKNPAKIPGPQSRLPGAAKKGFKFSERGYLEIPDHYLRDAGMESHADDFWQRMVASGEALEPVEEAELAWWAAGGTEASQATDDSEEVPGFGGADAWPDDW